MELHPKEAALFEGSDDEAQEQLSDEEINEKYVRGEVRIVTEQARYPLNSITSMLDGGSYELNPEFQRRNRWSRDRQSRLMESFIMNVPIPPIFLYEDEYSHYEVMDGLQRLTAIRSFYNNDFPLEGLDQWPELNGRRYNELPDQVRKGIDRRYLSSIILLQETAKSHEEALRLKQLVFERINSGGAKLEDQESRNAIYNGPLNQLCIRLARNRYLCRCWDIPEDSTLFDGVPTQELIDNDDYRRMRDVELVLRFFAHRQRTTQHQGGALKAYLDEFQKRGNLLDEDTLDFFRRLFEDTIELVYSIFGPGAFWLWRKRKAKSGEAWGWYQRPTTTVYDPLMYAASHYLDNREQLLSRSAEITQALPQFYQEHYDRFEGRYTNMSDLKTRNELFLEFIGRFAE